MTELTLLQVDSPAFAELLTKVAKEAATTALKEAETFLNKKKDGPTVTPKRAMEILGCGTTKFQQLRDDGEIELTDDRKPMYFTESLYEYQKRHKRKKSR